MRCATRSDTIRSISAPAEDDYRASRIAGEAIEFCVPKAILLTAALRAAGIPAAVGFADVRNHLNSPKLAELMGTDLFIYHGYVALWLDGTDVQGNAGVQYRAVRAVRRQAADLRRQAATRCFTNSTPTAIAIWNMSTIAAGLPIRRSNNCCGSFALPIRNCGSSVADRIPSATPPFNGERWIEASGYLAPCCGPLAAVWHIARRSVRPSRVQSPVSGSARCRRRSAGPSRRGSADGTADRWCSRNGRG